MDKKEEAALAALGLVRDGMTLGLGTGTTAEIFIRLLAARARDEKLSVSGVPTSRYSEHLARQLGLRVASPNEVERIDLAVDGADAVDDNLFLVKGGGGAHWREKIIDYWARVFVVIIDEAKLRPLESVPLPVEFTPLSAKPVREALATLGFSARLRSGNDGRPFHTDSGNWIYDCTGVILDAPKLERDLDAIPGVVENGLFTRPCIVLAGTGQGVKRLEK